LRNHPGLDVNWKNEDEADSTALHLASEGGHAEVVKLLLAHPQINVNQRDLYESTSILRGCSSRRVPVLRLLLKDPRVDVSLFDIEDNTPLMCVSTIGCLESVKWLIASGKVLDGIRRATGIFSKCTALEIAVIWKRTEVASLLERFAANPTQTRHEIRIELGFPDELAAEHFALLIFLCDGLFQIPPAPIDLPAARFFAMTKRFPMELQMIMCHRVVGSAKDSIISKDSEAAFKSLAWILHLQ